MAERLMAAGQSTPRQARDPVNLPMVRNWVEAIGAANPVYTDPAVAAISAHGTLVAPPAMVQVWTMPGLHPARGADDPLGQMSAMLDEAGYTSVVATNCDQVYHRYLRHGEQLAVRTSLVDVTGPKRTALGQGWFVTTRSTWYAGDEPVATMVFRILKFRPRASPEPVPAPSSSPAEAAPPGLAMRPLISADTAFFWAGTAIGELRIQRCADCGALRHPPGPMCPECGAGNPEYLVAAGVGEVFSYVVHHHPPVPGKQLPIVIVLVRLHEGVRIIGELLGARPEQVRIGLPVRVEYVRIDDELALPAWRPDERADEGEHGGRAMAAPNAQPPAGESQPPAGESQPPAEDRSPGNRLPELEIDASTTFVVSSALATRDFQDVHHDRDKAVARGSKDIFVNILTSTGLVQRYVCEWAGPEAILRQISIRLGAPCYAGDTLIFSGYVTEHAAGPAGDAAGPAGDAAGPAGDAAGDPGGGPVTDRYEVAVVGRCSLGDHITGTVRIDVPRIQP